MNKYKEINTFSYIIKSKCAIKTSEFAKQRALMGHKTDFDNITIMDKRVTNTLLCRIKKFILSTKNHN